jgi:putative salt-induced outer membrane protein YdiY
MITMLHLARLIRPSLSLLVALALLAASIPSAAQDDDDPRGYYDKVFLRNGDVLTGKIKDLNRGRLRVKTRTMDTVFINWLDVKALRTDKYLRVERTSGEFNYGTIGMSDRTGELLIDDGSEVAQVPVLDVSLIQPIRDRESFWRNVEGDISAGVDYKKASDVLLINLSSNVRLRKEKYEVSIGANWNETSRTEDNNSSRADVSSTYTRFLGDSWFWKASTGFERNEELGLELRGLVGGTVGRYLLRTPMLSFELNGGLAGNWEQRSDDTTTTSAEALIRSSLDIFKYSLPSTRLSANVNVFPGITESSRVRVNSEVTLRNEIVDSLFLNLTFYHTYDNQPPDGSSKEDFGIVTSVGASF